MFCIEHLISSAYKSIEKHWTYEYWLEQTSTQENLICVCAQANEIWAMAQYVYFSIKPCIECDKEDEMIKKYGYRLEGE